MSTRVRDLLMQAFDERRHEPIEKRIRAELGGRTVIDTRRALLVWPPRRPVPAYAVPLDELGDGVPPDAVHADDDDLAGYAILDFGAFDAWYEEDEPNVGHPRDPFHRIDILHSSRHVRVELDGDVLAESTRPCLLFETMLPIRFYLPAQDVRLDRLTRTDTRSTCAYKGHASYWAHPAHGDIAWFYPEPLREAAEIRDRIAFFNEHVDLIVDGERLERPVTPWSKRR
ncbi:DUF427 domain-containing protein [Capillimicrobium parvum]|uniref:DUF427 domain-containing protein n=1 Tax=Capillimicrobium parvum TaxID=2884022 RepID=A0A9E6Y276_9ACTN|nr:DUF427 domain-containing protein [Capillimicrobium parvum]UGS38061.1 hypothetical protein DSM104329_04483 [Capillimicrobium parvum]